MHSSVELVAIYTQPDRPAGRGRRISESPVKLAARASGLPLRQPLQLDDDLDFLRSLAPDLFAVDASTFMPRCCRAGEVPHPYNELSKRETASAASR